MHVLPRCRQNSWRDDQSQGTNGSDGARRTLGILVPSLLVVPYDEGLALNAPNWGDCSASRLEAKVEGILKCHLDYPRRVLTLDGVRLWTITKEGEAPLIANLVGEAGGFG